MRCCKFFERCLNDSHSTNLNLLFFFLKKNGLQAMFNGKKTERRKDSSHSTQRTAGKMKPHQWLGGGIQ
jgi:hypothetical protein